jgi:hypothetical protein
LAGFAEEQASPATSAAPTAASSSITGEKEATYLICKNKASVRTLRVQTRKNGSCFTTYTKNGVDQVVSNTSDHGRCSKVMSNIRENLEKGNWKCKDISEARVSSSE